MHTKRYAPECYARSLASDRRLGRLEQHDAKLTTVLGTTQLELEAVSERCWTGALHAASEAPDACNPS